MENMNLKFRVWAQDYKMMFDVNSIYWFRDNFSITCGTVDNDFEFDEKEIELMQSTGIMSSDNKLVFEGDILAHDHGGGVNCYIIERNPDDNQLHARYLYTPGYGTDYLAEAPIKGSIVVGNRWENPNLLDE